MTSAQKPPIQTNNLSADEFYRQASEGATFVWTGDFHNAKELLQAVQRRIDKRATKSKKATHGTAEDFHRYRQQQSHRAQLLARLLIPVDANLSIPLGRAPEVKSAILEALPNAKGPFHLSLRELLGIIGAHEWRKRGVLIPFLGATIHPHYGVFAPVRGEYLDLVAEAPLPSSVERAFDIGTGTGVIAAILAKRGVKTIVATDTDPRARVCAKENLERLGFSTQVDIVDANLFPQGKADLIVCNPPWIPARPTSPLEFAVYDENSQMLHGFLSGVSAHLETDGEAWLIMSDLAEHLHLRNPNELEGLIAASDLKVLGRLETKPKHKKVSDESDSLHLARAKEVTSLWRLGK